MWIWEKQKQLDLSREQCCTHQKWVFVVRSQAKNPMLSATSRSFFSSDHCIVPFLLISPTLSLYLVVHLKLATKALFIPTPGPSCSLSLSHSFFILFAFNSSELDFSRGHPSWYYSHRSTLNCKVLIGSWLWSSDRFMTITALKCVVSRRVCLYI
jgi:hypothetical protein